MCQKMCFVLNILPLPAVLTCWSWKRWCRKWLALRSQMRWPQSSWRPWPEESNSKLRFVDSSTVIIPKCSLWSKICVTTWTSAAPELRSLSLCMWLSIGWLLRSDQEHQEVITASEGCAAGPWIGFATVSTHGPATKRCGVLRGWRETPETCWPPLWPGINRLSIY